MIKIISPWFIRAFRPKGVNATTFIPFVVVFRTAELSENKEIVNHEAIHTRQMLELGWIGMWPIILWCKFQGKQNPFEKEAYAHQKNLDYLKTRKRYAWVVPSPSEPPPSPL